MKTVKEVYAAWLSQGIELPIFYQPWWLDAACGADHWSVVLAYEGELIVGIWPYYVRRRLMGWLPTLDKPPLTLFCGPYLLPPGQVMNKANQLSRNQRIIRQLHVQLPDYRFRRASLPYASQAGWPLQLLGWRIRQCYSYRIRSDAYAPDVLWRQLSGKLRSKLRQAQEQNGRIEPFDNADAFQALFQQSLAKRPEKVAFPHRAFKRLFEQSLQKKKARCWAFFNDENQVIAAVWLPFDQQSAYLLGAASLPYLRNTTKAMPYLIWHAIQWCTQEKLIFDFEGSSLPGVEPFYRSFGPEIAGYQLVSNSRI
ncbi:MAG: GNAT family N-acetyltransferase [Bacteroidota bacterium]